jgi:hypothetical protein
VSYHPRCAHARYAEQARRRALELAPPPVMRADGMDVTVMSGSLAALIDLSCPLECLNGQCGHEPKREGPVGADG